MSTENIQVGIYCIDKNLFEDKLLEEIIEHIISAHNNKIEAQANKAEYCEKEKFTEQILRTDINLNNFKARVFYSEKYRIPKWRSFLANVLNNEQDLLKGRNHDISYVAFICDQTHLYAISGGQGNFVVQDYIDQNFGIRLISHLIDKKSKVIKFLQDRGLTGSIIASTRFFRGDSKLSDEDEFGKIYKQIKAELGEEILSREFGFTPKEVKGNVGCMAKSSFQINKSIDFSRLLNILTNITRLLDKPSLLPLNKVKVISRRGEKNKRLIEQLENELYRQLYEDLIDSNSGKDFDFCNPDYEKYLTANNYHVYKGYSQDPLIERRKLDDVHLLLKTLEEIKIISPDNLSGFRDNLTKVRIKSFDTDSRLLTSDLFIKHVHGEIKHDEMTYFHIDGEWYEIQSDFLEDLNDDCRDVIEASIDQSILNKTWIDSTDSDENKYIEQFLKEENFLVFHMITAENLELCDLIKYDDSDLYIIHVKQGFNNSIRELTSQISIAARRLVEDIKGNSFDYLRALYQSLKSKSLSNDDYFQKVFEQTQRISEENFLQLFKRKTIHFVLAFVDTAKIERDVSSDIRQFSSNIAKFSVVELKRNLRRLDVNLKIAQIKKSSSNWAEA